MHRVVGTDQEIAADPGKLARGSQHDVAHSPPVAAIDGAHVVGERGSMHGDLGMGMRTEDVGALLAYRPITKRCPFRRAGDDPDMLRHGGYSFVPDYIEWVVGVEPARRN